LGVDRRRSGQKYEAQDASQGFLKRATVRVR
jgi:hypothetical protein